MFDDLVVARDGSIWLRPHRRGSDLPPRYLVLDEEGRELGFVRLPDDVRILEVGTSHVLALYRDERGVETVSAYELLR